MKGTFLFCGKLDNYFVFITLIITVRSTNWVGISCEQYTNNIFFSKLGIKFQRLLYFRENNLRYSDLLSSSQEYLMLITVVTVKYKTLVIILQLFHDSRSWEFSGQIIVVLAMELLKSDVS